MPLLRLRIAFLLLSFCLPQQVFLLTCKNEQNQDVDWFVAYKLPKMSESNNHLIREGVAYLYIDETTLSKGWTLSRKDIGAEDSMFAYTLAPFYDKKNEKDYLWLLYNDQPPNEPAVMYNGHSKGAVITNKLSGFWLVHSVPNFPPQPDHGQGSRRQTIPRNLNDTDEILRSKINNLPIGKYAYPTSGRVNGQSFLCITMPDSSLKTIGEQLMYNQIIVYKKNLPDDLAKEYPTLVNAANEKKIKKEPFNKKATFNSKSGMHYYSFAKSGKWGKDLYDDFVAPELKTDLYAETWLNGRGKLPSDCNKTNVYNVKSVKLETAEVQFKSSHDHSKWAVGVDGKNNAWWTCIGDINRADTQFDRGGGTVCFSIREVWKNYKDSVNDVEPCPKKGIVGKVKDWFRGIFTSG